MYCLCQNPCDGLQYLKRWSVLVWFHFIAVLCVRMEWDEDVSRLLAWDVGNPAGYSCVCNVASRVGGDYENLSFWVVMLGSGLIPPLIILFFRTCLNFPSHSTIWVDLLTSLWQSSPLYKQCSCKPVLPGHIKTTSGFYPSTQSRPALSKPGEVTRVIKTVES